MFARKDQLMEAGMPFCQAKAWSYTVYSLRRHSFYADPRMPSRRDED